MTLSRSNLKKGFTLLESLVSISLLLIAVGGPLFVASRGISNGTSVRNNAIASYLAQEGIEVMRKVRDDGALASPSVWIADDPIVATGVANTRADCVRLQGQLGQPCTVDAIVDVHDGNAPAAFKTCAGVCPPMITETGQSGIAAIGLYRQKGTGSVTGDDTIFTRTVRLIRAVASNNAENREIVASTTVSWSEGNVTKSYTLQDTFFRN